MISREVLKLQKLAANIDRFHEHFNGKFRISKDEEIKKLLEYVETIFEGKLGNNYDSSIDVVRNFEIGIIDDLLLYNDYIEIKEKISFGLIEKLSTNGSAWSFSDGSHCITLNYGLFLFACNVAEAILMESDTPQSGLFKLNYTVKLFILDTLNHKYKKNFKLYENTSASIIGSKVKIEFEAGSIGAIVMRFFALHELGHIILGHTKNGERAKFSMVDGHIDPSIESKNSMLVSHSMELEADQYAFERILERTSSAEQMWNNVFHIIANFRILGTVEYLINRPICAAHPSGQFRAEQLLKIAIDRMGLPSHDKFVWLDMIVGTWRNDAMHNLEISLFSSEPEKIETYFGEDKTVIGHGVTMTLIKINAPKSATIRESIFAITISFVAGVPSGIVANYIYSTLTNNGQNTVVIGDAACKTSAQIENALSKSIPHSAPPTPSP